MAENNAATAGFKKTGALTPAQVAAEKAKMEAFYERAQLAQAPAWMPSEGDILSGEVVGFRQGTTEKFDDYPIVIFKTLENKYVAFHCFHSLVRERLAELKPQKGHTLTVMYGGKRVTNETKDKPVDEQTMYHVYYIESGTGTDGAPAAVLDEMTF